MTVEQGKLEPESAQVGPAELAIAGGRLITPAGSRVADLEISDGRIRAIRSCAREAHQRIDARGLLVFPGMVEAHAHFMDPADPARETFPAGSAAAAAAGVTTVIEHTHAEPVVAADDLLEKAEYLRDRSVIDFALAAHALPDRLDAVEGVWRAGAAFVKAFTCTTHGLPGFDSEALRTLLEISAGLDATCLLHCEDEALTQAAERSLRESGRSDGAIVPEWRNREAELVALDTAIRLASGTGAHTVFAHVSHVAAIQLLAEGRARGARVAIETCPQYLTLFESEVLEQGALRKFTPPARARSARDLERMWKAVEDGSVTYVSSDHAPSTLSQKREGSIWDVHFGLPGVDTTLPILLDAAIEGRISYESLARVYSEAPAETYGLADRKGRIAVGHDADLVLVDPAGEWAVADADIHSRAGWSPFSGRTLKGRVKRTLLRGREVAAERKVTGTPGDGRFLTGRGAR